MLRSLKSLVHYKISATDGELGKIENFLLDDKQWIVRYMIVETGGFLDGRRVLISPISFRNVEWSSHRFHLALTMDKIKHSPDIDVDKPVSRQHERAYLGYYGYASYWGYSGPMGMGAYPSLLLNGTMNRPPEDTSKTPPGDVHLRSAAEIRGYHVQGSDEAIGHVDDFIVDDETWSIRYLVIDTRNWWFGKKVLIAPHWASRISIEKRTVSIALSRQEIKSSPEWNGDAVIDRDYEMRLHSHYRRPPYWDERPAAESPSRPQIHPPL